jgi:hypothetical protein
VKRYSYLLPSAVRVKILTALFLCIAIPAVSQNNELADVLKKFNTHSRDNLHEKVFLHTDKETYLANEILWVKAYSFNEMLHTPMALSRVVYIELVDAARTAAFQAKIELTNGQGKGSIDLSGLATGTYRLRAYTRWMMNYDERYFFEKNIIVINAQGVPTEKKAAARSVVHVDFYPEGGHLVEGLTSTVGFKITDSFGRGLKANGVIVDHNNATVATFEPLLFGLGKFTFTPQPGVQYKAVVTCQGEATSHKLPEVAPAGYVMEVTGNEKLSIAVSRNNPSVESEYVLLLAHTRQQVKSVLVAYFKENKAVFTIDKNKLGDGISHITLFDRLKNPICERLVFKKPVNQLVIESKPQAYQFSPREEVKVSINTHDTKAVPVAAHLSFSMYALDSLQEAPQAMGILSYAFLVSDLGDRIEQPDFYFSQNDSIAVKATDNLMLTHGWRKFDWKKIMNSEVPALTYAPEYEGQIITGVARDEASGALADSANVFLSMAGTNPVFRVVKTDGKGNFQFAVNDLHGLNPVIFQASGYSVQLNDPFDMRRDTHFTLLDFSPARSTEQTLVVSNIHTQVERAFQNPDTFVHVPRDTIRFYGKPSVSYLLDDYVRFPTLEDVFREYVPGIIVRRPAKKAQLYVLNNASELFFEREPLILLDGMPVLDTDLLLRTDAASVKRINIVNHKYFIGPVACNGIVDISTYRGNFGGFDIDPKALVIDYDGLQSMRTFSSPDYSTAENKSSRVPDFRNVLHWQPDAGTDENGNDLISFYTSDKKGSYIGVIHGITNDGLMGSRTFTITVK